MTFGFVCWTRSIKGKWGTEVGNCFPFTPHFHHSLQPNISLFSPWHFSPLFTTSHPFSNLLAYIHPSLAHLCHIPSSFPDLSHLHWSEESPSTRNVTYILSIDAIWLHVPPALVFHSRFQYQQLIASWLNQVFNFSSGWQMFQLCS